MKSDLNLSKFFNPPDAWDSIIQVYQKDPIEDFNKLNFKTQFDESLNIQSLNHFFPELIDHIKTNSIQYVNNMVYGFISILLSKADNTDFMDTAFFQISKEMFNCIYKRNSKYVSILNIVSLFDIFSSNLPISISYGHLFHIQQEQAELIHKYLYDGNDNSLAVKCLAISLAFPSARFDESNPDYTSYCEIIKSIDHKKIQFFPDPTVMLDKSKYFTTNDIIYACFTVQYSNSLVFSIGLDHLLFTTQNNNNADNSFSSLDLAKCYSLQALITDSELSLGSLCHSIHIHTTHPSTICALQHFLSALDNSCGIELLKELFIMNMTPSFRHLVKSYGSSLLLNVFKSIYSEDDSNGSPSTNGLFLDLVLPFHPDTEKLSAVIRDLVDMARVDEDRRAVLPFLGAAHAVLLRLLVDDLSSTYRVLVENFNGIALVVETFFEMLTLQPQFERSEVVHASVCVVALLYRCVERLQLRSLSSRFMRGTLECVYYLVHVPVDTVTFLLFDVQSAQEEVRAFVSSHEAILNAYMVRVMPNFLMPAASVVASYFMDQDAVDPSVVVRVVEYAVLTYVPQVFYAARSAVTAFCRGASEEKIATFSKKLFDLYFTLIAPTSIHDESASEFAHEMNDCSKFDHDDLLHTQTLYLLTVSEVLNANRYAVRLFLSHPAFPVFYSDAQRQLAEMPAPYTHLICPLIAVLEAVWRGAGCQFEAAGIKMADQKRPQKVKSDQHEQDGNELEEVTCEVKNEPEYDMFIPELDSLLMNIQFLWAPTATCLLSLALSVAQRLRSFPYAMNAAAVVSSAAENSREFLDKVSLFPGADMSAHASSRKAAHAVKSAAQLDCGLAWSGDSYDYDFIITQKPLAVFARSITIPNSQIIEEDDYEEEEEEDNKESESSEF